MAKRESPEWVSPIVKIILLNENNCNLDTLYSTIPNYIQFTEQELRASGIAGETLWRGTLRGYLSHLVKDGELDRTYDYKNKPWYNVRNPNGWDFLFE